MVLIAPSRIWYSGHLEVGILAIWKNDEFRINQAEQRCLARYNLVEDLWHRFGDHPETYRHDAPIRSAT